MGIAGVFSRDSRQCLLETFIPQIRVTRTLFTEYHSQYFMRITPIRRTFDFDGTSFWAKLFALEHVPLAEKPLARASEANTVGSVILRPWVRLIFCSIGKERRYENAA